MKVFVYYNLHKKVWSVKALEGPQKGRVIGHATMVVLRDCVFKVSEAGRQRVLREKKKNVHAGVVGTLIAKDGEEAFFPYMESVQVTYNPYHHNTFVYWISKEPIFLADHVLMTANSGPKVRAA